MIEGILITLLVAVLVIAILKWLCPMAGIPGNITQILIIIVIVITIFKLLGQLGVGL